MPDEYEKARAERKRLYETVRTVLANYSPKNAMRKRDFEKALNSPYPAGICWEIEFREIAELSKFFGLKNSLEVHRD
jgi:hypothetical protein